MDIWDESIFVTFQNYALPVYLLQSPWSKETGLPKKLLVFWCLFSILFYKRLIEIVSSILVFNNTNIPEVLDLLYYLILTVSSPVFIFYYQIWKRDVPVTFGENQANIDSMLKTSNAAIPKTHVLTAVFVFFLGIFFTIAGPSHHFNYLQFGWLIQWITFRIQEILLLQWVMLILMVKVRYDRCKGMISQLQDVSERILQSSQDVDVDCTDKSNLVFDSIEAFRRIRENHAIINGHFAMVCRIFYTLWASGMMSSSYKIWEQSFLHRNDEVRRITGVEIFTYVSMSYCILSVVEISVNNEVSMFELFWLV